jgi:hypothetical protein
MAMQAVESSLRTRNDDPVNLRTENFCNFSALIPKDLFHNIDNKQVIAEVKSFVMN